MSTVQSQDLIVLGLLTRRPRHGYEMRQRIGTWLGEVAEVTPGTLYYTLKKLARRGLITSTQDKKGNRPERTVYAITKAGRKVFRELLRESLFLDERPYYLFDLGLFFAEHIEPAVLQQAVQEKLARVAEIQQRIESLEQSNPGPWPLHLEALRRKGRLVTDAFEAWYRYLSTALLQESRRGNRARPAATRSTSSRNHKGRRRPAREASS